MSAAAGDDHRWHCAPSGRLHSWPQPNSASEELGQPLSPLAGCSIPACPLGLALYSFLIKTEKPIASRARF